MPKLETENSDFAMAKSEAAEVLKASRGGCDVEADSGPGCGGIAGVQRAGGSASAGAGANRLHLCEPVADSARQLGAVFREQRKNHQPASPENAQRRRHHRSEERCVGKECRSRWSPYH